MTEEELDRYEIQLRFYWLYLKERFPESDTLIRAEYRDLRDILYVNSILKTPKDKS